MSTEVTLTFRLDEPVTPDHLALRVAEACEAYGALRPGEGVLIPSNPVAEYRIRGLTSSV